MATAANSSRSPAESAPPPWRNANAITSAAPATDAIQNSGLGRSWVMTTATSAVAIGRMPSTTPPCEASTVCIASAIRNGNRMLDAEHRDRRVAATAARRQRPAQHDQQRQRAQPGDRGAQRGQAIGSIADTAIRVAGSVPPKIAMPMKPSNRPRRSRDNGRGGHDARGSEFARARTAFGCCAWRPCTRCRNDGQCTPKLLQTRPTPDRNSRPSTTSRKFRSLSA